MVPNICQSSGSTQISHGSHRLGLWFYCLFLGYSWSPKAEGGLSWSGRCSWWDSYKCQLSGRPSSDHRTEKGQSSSWFPRRVGLKNVPTIGQLHTSPMLVRWCLKCCMLSFSITWTRNFDIQAGFRKGRGTRDQIANICWIIEKAREFQKNIYLCLINYAKAFDCVVVVVVVKSLSRVWLFKLWKALKEMGLPDHLICILRNLYAGQEATLRTLCGRADWFRSRTGLPPATLFV